MSLAPKGESQRTPGLLSSRVVWLIVATFLVSACGSSGSNAPSPSTPAITDADADGVAASLDCDDNDSSRSRALAYAARDRDGDAYVVAESGSLCAGATLPLGYFVAVDTAVLDCDDANVGIWRTATLFVDADGDGVGTGAGQDQCIGAAATAGTAFATGDCNDTNAALWAALRYEARDEDGDGRQRAEAAVLCTAGTLPARHFPALSADLDCDDRDGSKWRIVALYRDIDGDGVGSGPYQLQCIGGQPAAGLSLRGYDPLDVLNDPDSPLVADFDVGQHIFVDPTGEEDDTPF
jgi:hypothetical protein